MNLILFLVAFPIISALLLLLFRRDSTRDLIVRLSVVIIAAFSIYLSYNFLGRNTIVFDVSFSHPVMSAMFIIEVFLALLVLYLSFKYKKALPVLLQIVSLGLLVYYEFNVAPKVAIGSELFVDDLSVIMALIIGIIGGIICLYSIPYMKDFHHHHPEFKDRRPLFFFILFAFLSAMFGIVFSNNLVWLFFFWEVTTLSSFLLIGYKRDDISIKNSFLALNINMGGGIAFFLAICYLASKYGTVNLDAMIGIGKVAAVVPVLLISLAGLTKSAQLPFSSWLVGAMVAPTPVSALLHSSTMVKAGVYIVIKMSPLLENTRAGIIVALFGGFTFLITSIIAVSQSDAKKVLAYSTIANLGLIILCAGIGSKEAMWAAILLIIFHAIAKGLLFLSVGFVEHKVGGRDVEVMDALVTKLPRTAWMMLIGMAGMFLAPFGMLISKWIVLRALIDASPMLTILVVFGSAVTLFFWTKWMGKLLVVPEKTENVESFTSDERVALYSLTAMTIGICLLFPVISHYVIVPYIYGPFSQASLGTGNIAIMLLMMGMVVLFRVGVWMSKKNDKHHMVAPYLSGRNVGDGTEFNATMNVHTKMSFRNYYLDDSFLSFWKISKKNKKK